MTLAKTYGMVLFALFSARNYQAILERGFGQFWCFLGLNTALSLLAYGGWLFLTFGTSAFTSFDEVSWTFPFLLNVFLVVITFCLVVVMAIFLVLYWAIKQFNRYDLDLREYTLMSLYSTVIITNIAMVVVTGVMYLFKLMVI